MEENKIENESNNVAVDKPNVYLVQAFTLKEDGTREKIEEGYLYRDAKGIGVDFGAYWEFGDGDLRLFSDDGVLFEDFQIWIDDMNIQRKKWDSLVENIEEGKWVEWEDQFDSLKIFRVEALRKSPPISIETTLKRSSINDAQKTRIKIYGKPIIGPGDLSSNGRALFCPEFENLISDVWERYIHGRSGVDVSVRVDESFISEDHLCRKMSISADSEKSLRMALSALGVNNPEKVPVVVRTGEGENTEKVIAILYIDNSLCD